MPWRWLVSLAFVVAAPAASFAQFGFGMGAICATAPGSRPVASGGAMMCQCPDGSFASMGVPCRPLAQAKPKSKPEPKRVEQIYCGSGQNGLSYYCAAGSSCTPDDIKSCIGADGKTQAAISRRLPAKERQAAEAGKKAVQQTADKIHAERAAIATVSEGVAKASVAAGLIGSIAQFAELTKKAQAAVPAHTSSAGLKGWTRAEEAKGERPEGRGYSTDYVRAIWPKITGEPLPAELGNAGQWYTNAQSLGMKTAPPSDAGLVPPGSIAVWDDGKLGHVGVVTRNDGSALEISEANWGPVRADASQFERENAITASFNRHAERKLSHTAAQVRSGTYKLAGFILPE